MHLDQDTLASLATHCAEAWSTVLGESACASLQIEAEAPENISAAEACPASDDDEGLDHAVVSAGLKGKGPRAFHLIAPVKHALALSTCATGSDTDAIRERLTATVDEAAFAEIGSLFDRAAETFAEALQSELGLEFAERKPLARMREARKLVSLLGGAACTRLRLKIAIPELDALHCDILLAACAPETAGAPCDGLVLIDSDEECIASARELEGALGLAVSIRSPGDLNLDRLDSLVQAKAIVVGWSLGSLSGLDVVEQLRRVAALADVPIGLADTAPTERMVRAALRGGAQTFLHKPLEADEIRGRLLQK